MPFDPAKSFTVVEDEPASSEFDPSQPFTVVEESSQFDPSKPYEIVEESPSFRPAILAPGESIPTVSGQIPAITQAFDTVSEQRERESKIPPLTLEEIEQIGFQPRIDLGRTFPEGTVKRAAENILKGIPEFLSSPLGIFTPAIQATPAGPAMDLLMSAAMFKSGSQKIGEASVTGNRQVLAEGIGELILGGSAGLHPALKEPLADLKAATKAGKPDLTTADLAAREALSIRDSAGETQMNRSLEQADAIVPKTAEALRETIQEVAETPKPEERIPNAIPIREAAPLFVEEPSGRSAEVGAQVREQAPAETPEETVGPVETLPIEPIGAMEVQQPAAMETPAPAGPVEPAGAPAPINTEVTKWLSDSSMVKPSGEPETFYHGSKSSKPIIKFDTSDINSENTQAAGIYVARDPSIASEYGEKGGVYPVILNIENPFRGTIDDFYKQFPEYQEGLGIPAKEAYDANTVREHMVEKGYDGQDAGWQVIAFYPEQIRSAIGIKEPAPAVAPKSAEPATGKATSYGTVGEGFYDAAKSIKTLESKLRDLNKQRAALESQPSAPDISKGPEAEQGAITGVKLTPSTLATVSSPIKGLHEITAELSKGLGLPIRFGRLTTNKFAGYFKEVANLIGSKKAVDMPVVSHEVGHKLESKLNFSSDRTLAAELDVLGDPTTPGSMSSWTKSKSYGYKLGEGMAEFTRYWLTDPLEAAKKAPNTFSAFEKAMDSNPDWGDVMRRAQDDIRLWRGAQDQIRLRSHLSVGENPNGTPYRLRQLTRDLVDDLHFLRLVVDDAEQLSGSKLAPTENIYVLARNLRGAFGRADTFIRNGVVDFKTKSVKIGTSFEDALKPIAGHLDDFRDWIVAKRAQELHKQGRETGLIQSDVDSVAARYDKVPEFQEAFQKLKDWNDSLMQYLEDSGFITKESHDAMNKMNADYVPFHRLFEIGAGEMSSQESIGTGRGLNVGKPGSLRRLHGSVRPIVDPIETMVKNAYTLTVAAEKGFIHQQLAALAEKPGMSKWVEKIATPKELERFGLEKIREQLEDAGADLTGVPNDLMLAFYKNARQAPFGENIIRVMRGGKVEFYRLNSELFDTFHALDMEDGGKIIQILAAPANLLRAGVTLAPDFAVANAIRDAFSSAIVSKNFLVPGEAVVRGVAAMIGNKKLVAEWKASGGKHSIEANYFDREKLQKFISEKITKDLTPAERALIYAKSPLVALRELSSIAEEATRIGEYSVAYNKLRKGGMTEGDARTMAAFESRDRQDFAKGGAKTKAIRMLAAFWNAGLQANVKLVQSFKERPVKTTLAGLAFITIPKMIEQSMNYDDQDYWDRPLWERDLFFLFPIGKDENDHTKFLRIPTPFEPGIIFGTLPGRLVALMKEKDPGAFRGFANNLLQQTIPNPIPNTLQSVFENFLSGKQGWDIFRGRQIVPDSLADLPPDMQWTEQTSLTAKKVGAILGFSPMKIDHLIAQTTGGLGRQLTYNFADLIISKATGEPRTAKGVLPGGRFIASPSGITSQAIEDFYKNASRIEGEEQRAKRLGQGQDFARLATGFRKASAAMSQLRKAARGATTDKEKQGYYLQMAEIARDMNQVAKEFKVPQ